VHSPSYEPWSPERAVEIIARHADREGALLPILHDLQHAFGYVPDDAVPLLAGALNVSRADVYGVVTFYHDYRSQPAKGRVLKLCQAEACQARGVAAVTREFEAQLGSAIGGASPDGRVTFEPVYCLGLCASGPSALLDGEPIARITVDRVSEVVREARG
jgi:formate dehydrogenase subunit gamma